MKTSRQPRLMPLAVCHSTISNYYIVKMSTIKQTLASHKNAVIIAATVALIAIACAFAVYLRLYTGKELWYEMFAAIIGVVITAIITMMLLVGQTDSDEKREKKGKVFEEKLRIYQEYLSILYNVIKDGKNTNEEKLKLAFKTSSVAMHCAPEKVEKISKNVKNIFELTINDNGNALETLGKKEWKELIKELFCIMDEFKADLYQDFKGNETFGWDNTLKNFTEAFSQDQYDNNMLQEMPSDTKDRVETVNTKAVDEEWERRKSEWREKGWGINDYLADKNGFMLTLTGSDAGNNNPAFIDVGWHDGHYYIQASYWRDTNFAKALKANYGGRRSYGTWWKYFDNEFYNIPEGELYSNFRNNEKLRNYLYEKIDCLMDIVEREHRTIQWLDKVGTRKGWDIFTWEWDTLACTYENDDFGRPYFDVHLNKASKKVVIDFANRAEQPELTKELIQRIDGCGSLKPEEDGNYILDEFDENTCDIHSKVIEWMDKIEEGAKK